MAKFSKKTVNFATNKIKISNYYDFSAKDFKAIKVGNYDNFAKFAKTVNFSNVFQIPANIIKIFKSQGFST